MARSPAVSKKKATTSLQPKMKSDANSLLKEMVDPSSVRVCAQKLREYENETKKCVQKGIIPGCASVVWRHGKVVQARCFGHADVESKKPYRMDTLCRLYCMTKSYISTAIMTLADEGRLHLDDPVSKYLPAFADIKVQPNGSSKAVKPKSPILLKHLLCHMSGVGYPADIGEKPDTLQQKQYGALQAAVQKGSITSLEAFVDRIAKVPLGFHPGEFYDYGYSYDVAARVLEVVMEKDLEHCLQERVFHPLGMHDTHFSVTPDKQHRLAALYGNDTTWKRLYGKKVGAKLISTKEGLVRLDGKHATESNWRHGKHCKVKSGGGFFGYLHGGLISSAGDTAKFVKMLISDGQFGNGQRLLKKETIATMEVNRLKKKWGCGGASYIGNNGVFRDGGKEVGMGGAACTYWSVDRTEGVATVWFTQHLDMPMPEDMQGVDPKKADLWSLMHEAVDKVPIKRIAGKRKNGETAQARPSKRSRAEA
mmetsp:Transcript_72603/g.126023  ORF Transcript_72603/g.126023 Transcript_72603/m.126023 type:complete len:480 (-) Transcript_72603:88-1527(-)